MNTTEMFVQQLSVDEQKPRQSRRMKFVQEEAKNDSDNDSIENVGGVAPPAASKMLNQVHEENKEDLVFEDKDALSKQNQ